MDCVEFHLALRLQGFLQHTDAAILPIVWWAALCEVTIGQVKSTHFSVFKYNLFLI